MAPAGEDLGIPKKHQNRGLKSRVRPPRLPRNFDASAQIWVGLVNLELGEGRRGFVHASPRIKFIGRRRGFGTQ